MRKRQLTYHLLTKFEFTTPGVDLQDLQVEGYQSSEVMKQLKMMQSTGLAEAIVARDKAGRPYAGAVVGITPSGSELLEAMRRNRLQ